MKYQIGQIAVSYTDNKGLNHRAVFDLRSAYSFTLLEDFIRSAYVPFSSIRFTVERWAS